MWELSALMDSPLAVRALARTLPKVCTGVVVLNFVLNSTAPMKPRDFTQMKKGGEAFSLLLSFCKC